MLMVEKQGRTGEFNAIMPQDERANLQNGMLVLCFNG